MKTIFKKYPFYFLLLPLSFFIHRYNELFGFLRGTDIILYFIFIYSFTGLAYTLVNFWLKSACKSAVIVFFVNLLILYFGAYHDFLKKVSGGAFVSSYTVVLPATLLLLFLLVFYFTRRKARLDNFALYLNILFSLFIVMDLVLFVKNGVEVAKSKNLIYPRMPISGKYTASGVDSSLKPDIYFIVLDEYTSSEALKELWHFDNREITSWLSDKGFLIIPGSKSNYDLTPFSVSATLNMQYIDSSAGRIKYTAGNILQAVKSMSHNETFAMLQKEGYAIRFIAPFMNDIEHAGMPREFDDFSGKQLYAHTLPARIQKDILWNFSSWLPGKAAAPERAKNKIQKYAAATKLVIQQIKQTAGSTSGGRPKFVYAHLMITHSPHLFDSTGKVRSLKQVYSGEPLFNSYVQQVLYANRVIREVVDVVRQENRKNTVIIIEGDHGFRDLPDTMQRYHFPNFSAIYFPDRGYHELYGSMSPVNTFRVVFNHYFRQKLPLLKDTSMAVKFNSGG